MGRHTWLLLLCFASTSGAQPPDPVNVRRAGAKGNGVTDDAPALQAALSAARPGATLFFPAGTYRIGAPLRLKSNLCLVGAGGGTSILRFTGKGSAPLLGTDVHDIRVSDLALQGTRSEPQAEENGGLAIRLTRGAGEVPLDVVVERVRVSGFRSSGVAVTGTGQAVATDVTIRDCAFSDLGLHGVLGYFVRRYHVEHCRFARLGRSGTIFPRCWDITVRDCFVRTTGWHGIEVGDESEGFLIEGNMVEDSGDHAGILVEQAAHRGIIAHNRITAPRFVGIMASNKPAKAAVKEVTITGNVIAMAPNSIRPAILMYGDTTYTADDCLVEGNTILGGTIGISAHYLKRCRFERNLVRGAQAQGLDLVFLNTVAVSGNTITDCPAEGIRITPYAEVFTNSEVSLTGNTIALEEGAKPEAPAIRIKCLKGGSVNGNRVRGFARELDLQQCEGVAVTGDAVQR